MTVYVALILLKCSCIKQYYAVNSQANNPKIQVFFEIGGLNLPNEIIAHRG